MDSATVLPELSSCYQDNEQNEIKEINIRDENNSKKRKRNLLEEIQNYIPEQYLTIKKRIIEITQAQQEAIHSNKESYYEKVALSSEKKRSKILEDGEVEPGSSRKKNKKERKKVQSKTKLKDVQKQQQALSRNKNPEIEYHNSAPVKYAAYLKERMNKKEEMKANKKVEQNASKQPTKEQIEIEQKNEYVNEPFPEELNSHQKNILLKVWKQRNFMDFNTWIQKSAAKLSISYENDLKGNISMKEQEEAGLEDQKVNPKSKKSVFHCKISVELEKDGLMVDIRIAAMAESKKDAKKRAFESLFQDLANRNLLHLGIKYKSYIDYVIAFEDVPNSTGLFHNLVKEQSNETFSKEVHTDAEKHLARMHKLSKRIQLAIQKNRFEDACRELQKMSETGVVIEWRWVCYLWGYCLRRKRAADLKFIIDIIQYGKLKKQESEEQYAEAIKNKFHITQSVDESTSINALKISVIRELRTSFKEVVRIDSSNPFDYYDKFNLDICNEQLPLHNSGVDLPEPVPRIFPDNYHLIVVKSPNLPIKINKPIYNYYNSLTFSGSSLTQPQTNTQNTNQQQKVLINKQRTSNQQGKNYQDLSSIHYKKEAFTNYLSLDMVQQMYETLIYESSDASFALQAAEVIYRYAKIDPDTFINPACQSYYTNRRIQLAEETIEVIQNSLYTSKIPKAIQNSHSTQYITNIKGSISNVGTIFEKDVYLFYPIENAAALEKKLLKRNQMDGTSYHHQICEDEMVVLTSFFKPTYEKPFMKSSNNKLVDYFNEKSRKREEQQAEECKIKGAILEELDVEDSYHKTYVDSITEYGNKVEFAVLAFVKEIQKDLGIKLYLNSPEKYKLDGTKTWKITKLCNLGLYIRCDESLTKAVTKSDSMSVILNKILTSPPLTNVFHLRALAETFVDKEMPIQNKDLNPQQYQALLVAHRQCLSLIQAPNGSGKMRVVKKLIQIWHSQNGKLKVLLCVHSSERMRQVYNSLKADHINAIEVSEKQTTKIEFTGLKTSVPDYEKTHNSMPRYYHSLKKALLGSQVVITNCSSANFSIMKGLFFQKVIILDAENLSEFSCLEALTKQCSQLVLIGDHLQQTVLSCNPFPSSRGSSVSLFERFVREGIRPILLSQNYRIPSSILSFTAKFFYKNLIFSSLKSKPTFNFMRPTQKQMIMGPFQSEFDSLPSQENQSHTDIDNYVWPNQQFKINFVHVEGYELRKYDQVINMKELEAVIHTTLYLFKSKTLKTDQLCIITPYPSQKNLIIEELDYHIKNNPSLFNLEEIDVMNLKSSVDVINVRTIEEVDKRYDFVLFTTVRSNKEGRLGSLRDPRRLNAVLSKTNEALIVIGDVFTLDNEFIWREFITLCKEKGVLSSYQI